MTAATVEISYHGTLAANTVDTICVLNPVSSLVIVNRGTSEIYLTVGSSVSPPTAAAVGASGTFVIPSVNGTSLVVPVPQESYTPPLGSVVSLISSGSPGYSVEAIIR